MDVVEMFRQMTVYAWAVAIILFVMSFWSIGRRLSASTPTTRRGNSRSSTRRRWRSNRDGRLKEAIALSGSKDFRYSHLAKVVLAGLAGVSVPAGERRTLNREDVPRHGAPVDSARHRADRIRPEEGRHGARDHRLDCTVRRTARHRHRRYQRVRGHRRYRNGQHRRRVGWYRGSAHRDRARIVRGDSGRGSTTT